MFQASPRDQGFLQLHVAQAGGGEDEAAGGGENLHRNHHPLARRRGKHAFIVSFTIITLIWSEVRSPAATLCAAVLEVSQTVTYKFIFTVYQPLFRMRR